jgi:rare lipoprotein A (peptidoglycan hydrolase)
MIALIPGLTSALASLQPQPAASKGRQSGFSQLLNSASQSLSSGESPVPPAPASYQVQPGDSLTAIAKKLGYDDPNALAQANQLKDPDRLQIGQVLTLPENIPVRSQPAAAKLATVALKPQAAPSQATAAVRPSKGRGQLVAASWYGAQHHGKLMANGRPFNMYADTAAHKNLPLGTQLTLTNPQNGNSVKVQVTDRGPYVSGRSLDLSYGAARKLGVVENGVSKVWMDGG